MSGTKAKLQLQAKTGLVSTSYQPGPDGKDVTCMAVMMLQLPDLVS